MAKKQNNDGPLDFDPNAGPIYDSLQRVATLQRVSMMHMHHQNLRISHLLSIMNVATGAQTALLSGGLPRRRNVVNSGEEWKDAGTPDSRKYDGGADAALDSLLAGTAMRLLKMVEDDSEWGREQMDEMNKNLVAWSNWEKLRAHQETNLAAASRRPSVLHAVELFNGPRGLWYAVMVPFDMTVKDDTHPVIGVGKNPVDAMYDFDRCFESGQVNPAAALWLEEYRETQERERKNACQKRSGRTKKSQS